MSKFSAWLRLCGCLLMATILSLSGQPAEAGLGLGDKDQSLYVHSWPDPVNVRSGNFYYPARDLHLPCYNMPLESSRSYNHFNALADGPFGKGWTYNYNLQVKLSGLDHPLIIEADGYRNEYLPHTDQAQTPREVLIQALTRVKKIHDRKKLGKARPNSHYVKYKKRLINNPEYLELEKAIYFPQQNKPISAIGRGTFSTIARGGSRLKVGKQNILRSFPSGRRELFDLDGKLQKIYDQKGNFLQLFYRPDDSLRQVKDSCGRALTFSWKAGRVNQVRDSFGRSVTYAYKDGFLRRVKGPDKKYANYNYDKRGRLNRIATGVGKIAIDYYTKFDRVMAQRGPGKNISKYRYGKKETMLWREISDAKGKVERFEYFPAKRRVVQVSKSGQKTITELSACCGKPERITDHKGRITTFQYDPKSGNLLKKVFPDGNVIRYSYDPSSKMVNLIRNTKNGTTRFIYNTKGEVTRASFTDKAGVITELKLRYAPKGKIQKISRQAENLSINYTSFGKPRAVTYKEAGKIRGILNTSYSPTGTVKNTSYRPKSPEVMQLMMGKIQQYMSILQPAGLDLS